jgi:hypothetical protein
MLAFGAELAASLYITKRMTVVDHVWYRPLIFAGAERCWPLRSR